MHYVHSKRRKTSSDRASCPTHHSIYAPDLEKASAGKFHSKIARYNVEITLKRLLETSLGRDLSVGTATRYGLDGPGIELEATFSAPVQTGPGAHPASYTTGTGSLQGVKRPGRGVDHPPHLAPRLKKE